MATREVGAATSERRRASPAIDAETLDVPTIDISVVHAGLDHATYALVVGTFAGEPLGGVERFVDRQFGGLLSSWIALDRYPTALGASRFIAPTLDGDAETEPPGCYVVGLGPFATFGRAQLTYAVRAALLDRCLALVASGVPQEHRAIGVSSTLLGVGSDDGLRVEDSVAAIVEAVLRVNRDLAAQDAAMPAAATGVRIAALELIDRYAERANLAAVALRSLATKVRLGGRYRSLQQVTVQSRDGGLPVGAALTDVEARWRRFLVAEAPPDRAPAPGDQRMVTLDVSLLGREARADRVRHHVDAAAVDALLDELSLEPGDRTTAATLYTHLVPEPLEGEFQTASAVQFVVDAATAKFPWELLVAPRGGSDAALAEAGSVMRQFAESDDRRLNPVRSASGRALVIGAGRLPGVAELPAIHDEVLHVADRLRATLGNAAVDAFDDNAGPLHLVQLHNALFGDHQLMHIAAHGVYRADDPDGTGALLTTDGILTVHIVRQLRWVPDVVFLNCCSLGKVGMNRTATGLARQFMAIGVRALVVAAWAVNDGAARAFAGTFYDEMVAGRPLGDAVARARVACASTGERQSWAAYQCYGDPGFVMRGSRPAVNSLVAVPVSHTDLVSRLDSLAVRTGDLGLAGRGPVNEGHERLTAAWRVLADWVAANPASATVEVQRRLGTIARDLGDFRAAADRLCPLVVASGGARPPGLLTRATQPADVQQAANCLARAAQRDARDAAARGDGATLDVARDDLDLATEIATVAVDILPEVESFAVLAGVLRRRATVDAARRESLLAEAVRAYGRCELPGYGQENGWQLALVLGGAEAERARSALEGAHPVHAPSTPAAGELVDQRTAPPAEFWIRARPGDRALTHCLAATDDDERRRHAADMVRRYRRVFATRSTWSQRQSVLATLRDLADLLSEGDGRRAVLRGALDELAGWEDAHSAAERHVPATVT